MFSYNLHNINCNTKIVKHYSMETKSIILCKYEYTVCDISQT